MRAVLRTTSPQRFIHTVAEIAGKLSLPSRMLPLPVLHCHPATFSNGNASSATSQASAPVNRHQRPLLLINPHEYHYVTFGIQRLASATTQRQAALPQFRHTLVQRQQVAVLLAFIPRERFAAHGVICAVHADFIAVINYMARRAR
ncbi:Uncharacterised protein [Salmonella enterica subsp. enterica serovar Derby]|nr:Uncharacterised protein [Salmonella enterica subsp. enterica serovar Derby]